jgi:hypothetical protein
MNNIVDKEYRDNQIVGRTWPKDIQPVVSLFYSKFKPHALSSDFIRKTMFIFTTNLKNSEVIDAMNKACAKFAPNDAEQCVKYFCGICWKLVRQLKQPILVIADEVKDLDPLEKRREADRNRQKRFRANHKINKQESK